MRVLHSLQSKQKTVARKQAHQCHSRHIIHSSSEFQTQPERSERIQRHRVRQIRQEPHGRAQVQVSANELRLEPARARTSTQLNNGYERLQLQHSACSKQHDQQSQRATSC